MRLLFICYEMNDESPVLAWQAAIARELSLLCESMVVFAEQAGKFRPGRNTQVVVTGGTPPAVLGQHGSQGVLDHPLFKALQRGWSPQVCFIHMAHKWAYRLWPVFFAMRMPVLLWYAHGTVTAHLRRALDSVDRVITSTPEGFRIPSPKVHVIGQGVNTEIFTIPEYTNVQKDCILYTGRISRRKRIDLMVLVMSALRKMAPELPLHLRLVGPILTADDEAYMRQVRALIAALGLEGVVEYMGALPQTTHPGLYSKSFLHLNVSQTGSMDKTVIEALACGCPVLTSNEAFTDLLRDYPAFHIDDDQPAAIARQILALHRDQRNHAPEHLRALVAGRNDQRSFAGKVYNHLRDLHENALARY